VNPWLSIPLADYEGHMSSVEVRQRELLSNLFAVVLERRRPVSVAVLGIAGGNGLERIDSSVTKRIVGLDLNPLYLDEVRNRYAGNCNLELCCVDLTEKRVELEPVELVHAALVFEHAGVGRCLDNALSLVSAGGALSVVLQLPSEIEQAVGSSQFASMQNLKNHFSFVDLVWFQGELSRRGFHVIHQEERSAAAGKRFWLGIFERDAVD
jgi:hypothetical protein